MVGALLLWGCDHDVASSPEPLSAGDLRSYVTPELSGRLASGGTFQLAAPPSGLRVNPEGAKALALAFTRTFGPYFRTTLEKQHGREIDVDRLGIASPVYYADTPFGPLPEDIHPAYRNGYGPYYIVYLASTDGAPAVVIAVAAHSEAKVEDGRITFPVNYGNDFYLEGVPLGEGFAMPLSPEQAVRRISEVTGARAAAVPELWRPNQGWHPVHSRWRVILDRPVAVQTRGSGQVQQVREIYVGLRGEFSVPSAVQPTGLVKPNIVTGGSVHVPIRSGRPVEFEAVSLLGR